MRRRDGDTGLTAGTGELTSEITLVEGVRVGAYRLIEQIGSGGMGQVWLAEHEMINRRAAIKILKPDAADEETVQRFFNEARAAAAISDPGIVQIFDYGLQDDGSAYIVMELLEGEPLDKRLRRQGKLPVMDALRLMRQVATSLGAAHARGIVHRDLKPQNLFVVRDSEVPGGERAKILDFGIAKLTREDAGLTTETHAFMGTPVYMAPEQWEDAGKADQRSDVYALGCVLFALVTGKPPFGTGNIAQMLAKHMYEPAPVASTLVEGVPPAVDQLLARCLAKDPSERFGSGTELARAITAITGPTGVMSLPSSILALPSISGSRPNGTRRSPGFATAAEAGTTTEATTISRSSGAMTVPKPAPRSLRMALLGTGIVALGAGATLVVWQQAADSDTPRSTSRSTAAMPSRAPVLTPIEPDAKTTTHANIARLATAFGDWAKTHAGAPCPGVAAIAPDEASQRDGWGESFVVTCSDQPAGHQIGIVSAGPDRVRGNDDDVASWNVDVDVSAIRGPRWQVPIAKIEPPPTGDKPKPKPKPSQGGGSLRPSRPVEDDKPPPPPPPPPDGGSPSKPSKPVKVLDVDKDGIPDERIKKPGAK